MPVAGSASMALAATPWNRVPAPRTVAAGLASLLWVTRKHSASSESGLPIGGGKRGFGMNAARFDRLSRALGSRSSRRNLGVGGLLGGLSVAFGSRSGFAQDETRTCDLSLVATVLVGPNREATYQGALTLPIGVDGAIEDGSVVPTSGSSVGVAGAATDRSIRMRIDLGESGVLSHGGVARRRVTGCQGEMNGIVGGPQTGDLGTWSMTQRSSAASGAAGTPGTGEDGEAEATRTPCPPQECGQTFVLDPDTCDCGCAGRSERCGEQCCPGGSMCDAPNQSCQCLAGMEICEDICAFPCPKGQVRDVNSCNCVQPGCPSGQLLCNGDCVDSMTDESNCGRCGTVCTAGSQCQGGVCSSCLALEIECTRDAQCCSGYCTFAGLRLQRLPGLSGNRLRRA